AGDLGLEMYIIRKGNVAVVGKQSQLMGLLGQGDYFGEIALFTQVRPRAAQRLGRVLAPVMDDSPMT
ncbi:cyclic nucleotide-binding domain-containing protein, partial [Haematococcus lacustris]